MRTTVSPDGLKVYNTADRQACVALQAGRLSASAPACTIQRSAVGIEWQSRPASRCSRLSASPIRCIMKQRSVVSTVCQKQTSTLLQAGHPHVFTCICQSPPAGLQLDGALAPSRTPAEHATMATIGACKGVRGALGAALLRGKRRWQAACEGRKGPSSLLWHRPAQACSAHEHECGQPL